MPIMFGIESGSDSHEKRFESFSAVECHNSSHLTRLTALIEKCAQAYNDYEFLVVTHAVNDFCVVEMSNF